MMNEEGEFKIRTNEDLPNLNEEVSVIEVSKSSRIEIRIEMTYRRRTTQSTLVR